VTWTGPALLGAGQGYIRTTSFYISDSHFSR